MTPTSFPNSAVHPRGEAGWRWAGLVVWAVAALLAYRFYRVVAKYAVNLFFFDEWDIYGGLFQGWPWWRFFLQEHGPHRQGLGVTVVVSLLKATHWDSRMQAYAIAIAIVLAMLLAIRLKISVFGKLQIFDVVIPVLFLGLGQWEVLLSAPGPSPQAFPLVLLVAYCLAWAPQTAWLRYAGIALFNFLLIFTGYGIFIAVITLALLAIDGLHTWRAGRSATSALTTWVFSAGSLALFFYRYVFSPAADCYRFPYHNPAAYFWFMGLMFGKFLGIKHATIFQALTGIAAVLVIAAVLARSFRLVWRRENRGDLLVVVLSGFTLIYAAAAAVGRVCLGMEAASSSRNLTLLIPGFLGVYFYLLGRDRNCMRTVMITALLIAVLPSAVQRNHKEIEGFSAMKRAWKRCYVATEDIDYCDASSHLQLYPQPDAIHLREKLAFLKRNHLNLYGDDH